MKKIFPAGFSILLALVVYEPNLVFAGPHLAVHGSNPDISIPRLVVSEKLLQKFRESFPDAERINWEESNDRYIVSFAERGILTRITYKKDGDFVSSFRNYGERDLPFYLINILKKRYPGQKIFGVTEITSISDITYFVKLEGPKYWITVSLNSEGACFVTEKYSKAL